jgi:hypothetical protein
MATGNTYHVVAPAHYKRFLIDGDVGPSWETAGAHAFARHLANQGRVVIGSLDPAHSEDHYWRTYLALEGS